MHCNFWIEIWTYIPCLRRAPGIFKYYILLFTSSISICVIISTANSSDYFSENEWKYYLPLTSKDTRSISICMVFSTANSSNCCTLFSLAFWSKLSKIFVFLLLCLLTRTISICVIFWTANSSHYYSLYSLYCIENERKYYLPWISQHTRSISICIIFLTANSSNYCALFSLFVFLLLSLHTLSISICVIFSSANSSHYYSLYSLFFTEN